MDELDKELKERFPLGNLGPLPKTNKITKEKVLENHKKCIKCKEPENDDKSFRIYLVYDIFASVMNNGDLEEDQYASIQFCQKCYEEILPEEYHFRDMEEGYDWMLNYGG